MKDATTGATLSDLTEEGERCVLVEGGEGGVGNAAFATAHCRRTRDYTEGSAGEEREVNLELKTIADVGMVRILGVGTGGGQGALCAHIQDTVSL